MSSGRAKVTTAFHVEPFSRPLSGQSVRSTGRLAHHAFCSGPTVPVSIGATAVPSVCLLCRLISTDINFLQSARQGSTLFLTSQAHFLTTASAASPRLRKLRRQFIVLGPNKWNNRTSSIRIGRSHCGKPSGAVRDFLKSRQSSAKNCARYSVKCSGKKNGKP